MAEQSSNDIITVVLTADNHLGYSAFGQHPRKREERLQRLRYAFQQTVDFAVGQGVDLFIQAGDLFDTVNPAEQDRSFVAARLAQLRQAGIRTFALGGVHDTPTDAGSYAEHEDQPPYGSAPQVSYARLGALHYFPPSPLAPRNLQHSIELEPVIVDVHGVLLAVCGLGVLAGQVGDPLVKLRVYSDIERAAISLLILHAPIEGLNAPDGPASQKRDIRDGASLTSSIAPDGAALDAQRRWSDGLVPRSDATVPMVARSTIAGQSSFHYILAGYHHDYQHLHIGNTDVIVAGATQHINFNDPDDDPGFVFLGLAADGIRWCNHITVDALHLRRLVMYTSELWPDGPNGIDSMGTTSHMPTDTIIERLRPLCAADTMVQLQLVGELTRHQYHQLDLSGVRHYGEEHCFELAIDESGLSLLPIDAHLAPESSTSPLNGHSVAVPATPSEVSITQRDERLSPREELVNLADEWIAAADDEQERKALLATKEELLAALDKMKWH